jgi:hypothetical protein
MFNLSCAVGMDVHLAVIHVCVILQEAGCEPEVHRRHSSVPSSMTDAPWPSGSPALPPTP